MQDSMSKKRRLSNQQLVDGATTGPNIRRMSRLDARQSVQYGFSNRRMSLASRHSSFSGYSLGQGGKPITKVANTYRLEPEKEERFNASSAEKVMKGVMTSYLEGEKYDKNLCTNLSKNLSDVIKERIKDMGFSARYKYVCMVTMGEVKGQGIAVSSRCVWYTDTDNYASVTYTHGNLFAVATLYAVYFE